MVKAGRVSLNGRVTDDPETPVYMGQDSVEVDGKPVEARQKIYWMMHKPEGVVTTADDEKGRRTVYDLLPEGMPWMGPVGRLDMGSEGLLLLSNDTEWAARITAPESHLPKTYHVQLARAVNGVVLQKFTAGIEDEGETLTAASARLLREERPEEGQSCWIEIVLTEGKNRQIRRMADACGLEVLRLIRVSIGKLELGNLEKGATRELTAAELQLLA